MNVAHNSLIRKNSHYSKTYSKIIMPRLITIEIFTILLSLSTIVIQELYVSNNAHPNNLRHLGQVKAPSLNTVYHNTTDISF